MRGVDISHYQKGLTIQQIKDAGCEFAIIKLTESNCLIDGEAFRFYHEAYTSGFPVGCYCYSYATTPEQARREAEFLLQTINGFPMPCGIFLDMEEEKQLALSKAELLAVIRSWCATIVRANYIPGIYASAGTLWSKISPEEVPVGTLVWVAKWSSSQPTIKCDIWQNSDSGRIGEYDGPVDTDVAVSDYFKGLIKDKGYGKDEIKDEECGHDSCPITKPNPVVMTLQMIMSYKGYWDETSGYMSPAFVESLHRFVNDLERGKI